jgi:7tm Chemosensory receptor
VAGTMKCSSVVKFLFTISLILIKVIGIHPIRFDKSSKNFVLSWLELAYTLALTCFFATAYSSLVEIYIGNMQERYRQGLVDLFLINFCRLLNFSVVVFYATQVYNRKDLVRFINEMYEHMVDLFERLPQKINYRVVLVLAAFRMSTLLGTYALTVYQPMSFMKGNELVDVMVACGSFLPYLIGTTLVSTYMAAALVLKHGYERISRGLGKVAAEVKRTQRQQFELNARKLNFITAYGNFTDELAGLLELYSRQNEMLKLLVRLSRNNVFFTTTSLFLTPLIVVSSMTSMYILV